MAEETRFSPRAVSLVVITSFVAVQYGIPALYEALALRTFDSEAWIPRVALNWGPDLVVSTIVAWFLVGRERIAHVLGIAASWREGVGMGFLFTLPLLLLFAVAARWVPGDTPWPLLLDRAVVSGFCEELLFRAMLFGLLVRLARWHFVPAAMIGAVCFGCAHAYQGGAWMETAGVVAITGFGALWFAWLYRKWNWNLWLVITLHVLMNLYWLWFDVGHNALGSGLGNLGRAMVIVASVVWTVRRSRKQPDAALRA